MSDIPPDISHDQYAVRLKKLQDMRTAGNVELDGIAGAGERDAGCPDQDRR